MRDKLICDREGTDERDDITCYRGETKDDR